MARARRVRLYDEEVAEAHPVDRLLHAAVGSATRSVSPASLALAYTDWALHLSMHPGKQTQLTEKALRKALRLGVYASRCMTHGSAEPCISPLANDNRFDDPAWQRMPYSLIYQSFLLTQQWWHNATTGVRGVDPHHEEVMNFVGRQLLDIWSPSNFLFTNPEIMQRTLEEGGQNLVRGFQNWVEDFEREIGRRPPVGVEKFKVGENLAATPGKVVYRNRLMELIQYSPSTKTVYPEPLLIVPAWIMKYYILDLSPGKSLVEYLVDRGHTVFMISWKNPTTEDRDLGLDDYRRLGVMDALDAVSAIVPEQKVHSVGYCLGGTLLMLAAATMARDHDERLASMTLFAAQADFTEPGELDLFIDESEVTFLEDVMWARGYLARGQMAGAFQLLRSQDLFWSRMVRDYLMGERQPIFDLMAWNADATRLPYRMHSQYLRDLFLNNDFVEGRFDVGGQPIHLGDIQAPIYAVGTEKDHVAPWESVYKIVRLARTETTFLLTKGGHNAGIVSEPGHQGRYYRVAAHQPFADLYMPPEEFLRQTPKKEGSWWPEWEQWLREHSGNRVQPPSMGAPDRGYRPVEDAPGTYVLMT
ncbi:MAG: alpha/beta fold hydrolase [Ectothiorhodospiraceae bacterium]|jgi:polyhydroxyalkanoate synthase